MKTHEIFREEALENPSPSGGFYAPPLTSCNSASGQCSSSPAGAVPLPQMPTEP